MSFRRRTHSTLPLLVVLLSLTAAATWALSARLPLLASYLLAVNVATLTAYLYDKAAAGSAWVRVPEAHLHAFAAAGGTPAALLGQRLFHHKTIKLSFRRWFWAIAVAQIALMIAWLWIASR